MDYATINILGEQKLFKYVFEYVNDAANLSKDHFSYEPDQDRVCFYDMNVNTRANTNFWEEYEGSGIRTYLPDQINISSINLYFPTFSVNTYDRDSKYVVTINTWIHNVPVYLGTYIIDRKEALAASEVKIFNNQRYYEVKNIKFIDPWFLAYADEWKAWRQNICGEEDVEGHELNNTGSILNISIHPVERVNDVYIKHSRFTGGQNSIQISNPVKDFMSYHIEMNRDENTLFNDDYNDDLGICVLGHLNFNTSYEHTIEGLRQYLKETYNLSEYKIVYELVVKDSDNAYSIISKEIDDVDILISRDDIKIDTWDDYIEGMRIVSSFNLYTTEEDPDDRDLMMSIMSNEIALTPDIARFFIGDNDIDHIKLTLIDMNEYNLNVVNKIEKKIYQVDRPSDYKANIIKPVYFRTRELGSLILHPQVTENLCLNLDAYKSQVEAFLIQIEGVTFTEIGRNHSGVIFKIIGRNLPNETVQGVYYILNQDSELVTTGKYTYEQ